MAIEWNLNSIQELLVKIEMAKGVKLLLNEVDNNLEKILLIKMIGNKNLIDCYDRICNLIEDMFNSSGDEYDYYDEEEYAYVNSPYEYTVEANSWLVKMLSLNIDIAELCAEDFFDVFDEASFMKLRFFNTFFNEDVNVDSLEDMIGQGQCLVRIGLKDDFAIEYVKQILEDKEELNKFLEIFEQLYFFDTTFLYVEDECVYIYGVHDINIGYSKKHIIYQNMVDYALKIMSLRELMKAHLDEKFYILSKLLDEGITNRYL